MTKEDIKALSRIYKTLKSGKSYVEHIAWRGIKYPYDHYVLSPITGRNGRQLFEWSHFGSSANPATFRELRWIFEHIFRETTPVEFEKNHSIA